ncbi:MAG: hypothetical protein R2838_15485 [Caldilineaceae bacterium]
MQLLGVEPDASRARKAGQQDQRDDIGRQNRPTWRAGPRQEDNTITS